MKLKRRLFLLAGIPALLLSGCKKSDSSDGSSSGNYVANVSFVINGNQFAKQTISIKGSSKGGNTCAYESKYKIGTTSISDAVNAGDTPKNDFLLIFNGNTTGSQTCGDDTNGGPYSSVYFQVSATDKSGKKHEYQFEDSYNTPGSFKITKFGAVGSTVEGTFSGTLIDENGDPSIQISSGTFSITRNADLN